MDSSGAVSAKFRAVQNQSVSKEFVIDTITIGDRTPGGVLGISSDGDDRRIFLGLKFSNPGFFWVRKFGKYFFG